MSLGLINCLMRYLGYFILNLPKFVVFKMQYNRTLKLVHDVLSVFQLIITFVFSCPLLSLFQPIFAIYWHFKCFHEHFCAFLSLSLACYGGEGTKRDVRPPPRYNIHHYVKYNDSQLICFTENYIPTIGYSQKIFEVRQTFKN